MKKTCLVGLTFQMILFALFPFKVQGLTLETSQNNITYKGTYHNSLEETGETELTFTSWDGRNGLAQLKRTPTDIIVLNVELVSDNTFRMSGTIGDSSPIFNAIANCSKSNTEIPSINCTYELVPTPNSPYSQRVYGEFLLSRQEITTESPSSNTRLYGAIAVFAYGSYYGYALNYSSKEEATNKALQYCFERSRGKCRIAVWFSNGCGALATHMFGYGSDYGPNKLEAERNALENCQSTYCQIRTALCTRNVVQ